MIAFFYRLGVTGLPLVGVLVVLSCFNPPTKAAAQPANLAAGRGLFVDVPAPALRVNLAASVSRRRVVTVDITAVRSLRSVQARLPFNLFADAAYEGVVEQVVDRGPDEFTLQGSLSGQPFSSFTLSVKADVAVLNVRTTDRGLFQLRHLENSFYDVRQIDESQYPPCGNEAKHSISIPARAGEPVQGAKSGGGPAADSGAILDVLVVYTAQARNAAGGTPSMQALINLAIDESNMAYQQSLITPRLRLVHQQEVSYTQSATFDTDLNRLTTPGDGHLDEVHALRNAYGADMVCLLIDNSQYCGLAHVMTSLSPGFEGSAFSVVHQGCATGYYSFAHELGHNMGCNHDLANSAGSGLYAYSYGWRFTGNDANEYRTVMAYAPGTRIPRFSNPGVLYQGVATGVATNLPNAAHNALTINNSAFTIANFRPSVGPCIFVLSSVSTNISSAAATGTFTFSTASNSCTWTGVTQSAFISLVGATNGTGNGSLAFAVLTNNGTTARTGSISVAGQFFTVVQAAYAVPLAVALDVPGTLWSTSGSANWFGQPGTTHDGVDAAQSGDLNGRETNYLEGIISGPGNLGFWWKVSSEANYDFLSVSVDGGVSNEISGNVDWTYVTLPLSSGPHTVRWTYRKDETVDAGADAGWVDQVQMPRRDFKILALTNSATVLNHTAVTGDDRGGMAASSTHVFYTGDSATARFSLLDLTGGTGLGPSYDGLISDLQTETVYLLASNNVPVSGSNFTGTANRLLELTATGTLSGGFIPLSQPIPLGGTRGGTQSGLFSGYGQIVLHNRTHVFSIALPSGLVNELGPLAEPAHVLSDSWAYWGVAEYFSNSVYLAYVRNSTGIYRMRVQDGTSNAVAAFANLGDMASFTVSVPRSRWYFHHETASQFSGAGEIIGYAGARFAPVPSGYFVVGSTVWSNNAVRVEFRGPPLTAAVVEFSSNLTSWLPIVTNVINTNGVLRYTNSAPGASHRIYRARVP